MKKILIIIPLFLLFGCGDKEAEITELEKRGGTTFHCPVYYEKDTIDLVVRNKTKEVVYTKHKDIEREDKFYSVSPDPQAYNYEPDPWKRSGDTWLITLYPPDRVLIHQRIAWDKWGDGIKKSIDHYFSEITYRNALLTMKVSDDSSLYVFEKVGLNFGRRSFRLYSSGGLRTNFGDETYECKEIDKTTLSEKMQEHENRLIIDEKLIQEKEEKEESKNKI